MIYWPTKTPAAIIDYGMDWGPTLSRLGNPSISTSNWAIVSGNVTLGISTIDGVETGVRVSEGTDGTNAVVQNTITLSDGEVLTEKAYLKVRA